MKSNNLEVKPESVDMNEVEAYLCHIKGITLEDLVHKGVFQKIKDINGYVPSFAPIEQKEALDVLPTLKLYF
jgi:hypothetical protein